MRILYLSNANNYHTIKWCRYFSHAGYEVHVATLEKPSEDARAEMPGVYVHWLKNSGNRLGSQLQKLGYFWAVPGARRLIERLKPDVVHAHYATSYGIICALTCRRPWYLSVWGSDVYDFPRKSPLHKMMLRYALEKCSWLLSTSEAMAKETRKYVDRAIDITPFGVDMNLFTPARRVRRRGSGKLVVGTVKALERKYGIDTLLKAVKELHDRRPELGVEVRIAGSGTLERTLKSLASELRMNSYLTWLGFIPQMDAATEWANFDIAVVASESESFGVSAVEAQASGAPLVITDIPGLIEACDGGATARVIPRRDYHALARAIEELADDSSAALSLAERARVYVEQTYELNACFAVVEEIYLKNRSDSNE